MAFLLSPLFVATFVLATDSFGKNLRVSLACLKSDRQMDDSSLLAQSEFNPS